MPFYFLALSLSKSESMAQNYIIIPFYFIFLGHSLSLSDSKQKAWRKTTS